MNVSTNLYIDPFDNDESSKESLYLDALFMCSMMVDNLVWLFKTSGLQDSEECAIMMEQTLAMQELIESALAIAEVSSETTFH